MLELEITALGILVKRELESDIDQLGRDCAQQITDELSRAKGATPSWGIGLVTFDSIYDRGLCNSAACRVHGQCCT